MSPFDRLIKKLPWRREPVSEGPFTLHPGRIYILPTKEGLFFAFGVVMLFLGSMNYAVSLGFALTFMLAAMGVVSAFYAQNNLKNLTLSVYNALPVFAGEPSVFPFRADNADAAKGVGLEFSPEGLPPSSEISRNFQKRGEYTLGLVKIQSKFPLGLFRSWAYINPAQKALVYPAPSLATPFPADPGNLSEGDTPFKSRTGVDEFSGLKDYTGGDSLQRIHWKAFARTGTLVVKEFDQLGGGRMVFDFDALKGLGDEERLSVLCRWVIEAGKLGQPFSLRLPGVAVPSGAGQGQALACLEALARWKG